MSTIEAKTDWIYSRLADDPDLSELVELFVEEIPERIEALEEIANNRDLAAMRVAAHQLKGALGSYGFDDLGKVAAALELEAKAATTFEQIESPLRALTQGMNRVRAGTVAG